MQLLLALGVSVAGAGRRSGDALIPEGGSAALKRQHRLAALERRTPPPICPIHSLQNEDECDAIRPQYYSRVYFKGTRECGPHTDTAGYFIMGCLCHKPLVSKGFRLRASAKPKVRPCRRSVLAETYGPTWDTRGYTWEFSRPTIGIEWEANGLQIFRISPHVENVGTCIMHMPEQEHGRGAYTFQNERTLWATTRQSGQEQTRLPTASGTPALAITTDMCSPRQGLCNLEMVGGAAGATPHEQAFARGTSSL